MTERRRRKACGLLAPRSASLRFVAAEGIQARIVVAVVLSLVCSAGVRRPFRHNPSHALLRWRWAPSVLASLSVALNRATPYLLSGDGGRPFVLAGHYRHRRRGPDRSRRAGAAADHLRWPDLRPRPSRPRSLLGAGRAARRLAGHDQRRPSTSGGGSTKCSSPSLLGFVGRCSSSRRSSGTLGRHRRRLPSVADTFERIALEVPSLEHAYRVLVALVGRLALSS